MPAYFDSQKLQREIIAALSLSPRPFSAGELALRCPEAPEQQSVSDTLRILKRHQKVILSGRLWSLAPGVTPDRETVQRMHQVLAQPLEPECKISSSTLRMAVLRLLRAALNNGEVYLEFYTLHSRIPVPVTHHHLSQLLNRMCEEGDIERLEDHYRTYKLHIRSAQSSLFADLLEAAPSLPEGQRMAHTPSGPVPPEVPAQDIPDSGTPPPRPTKTPDQEVNPPKPSCVVDDRSRPARTGKDRRIADKIHRAHITRKIRNHEAP